MPVLGVTAGNAKCGRRHSSPPLIDRDRLARDAFRSAIEIEQPFETIATAAVLTLAFVQKCVQTGPSHFGKRVQVDAALFTCNSGRQFVQ